MRADVQTQAGLGGTAGPELWVCSEEVCTCNFSYREEPGLRSGLEKSKSPSGAEENWPLFNYVALEFPKKKTP